MFSSFSSSPWPSTSTASSLPAFEALLAAELDGLFDPELPMFIARAPGRLDFLGGNVDYTGGMVLQGLLREAIHVAVQPRRDGVIRIVNREVAQFGWVSDVVCRAADLISPSGVRALAEADAASRWTAHVLGALYLLQRNYGCRVEGGANLFISSDLPPNKGVSSSAALQIAVLRAASTAWNVSICGVELATAGQWVENVIVGAACGIMDQAAIVLGQENHLLPVLCQPCRPGVPVLLPAGLQVWGIDSMVPRSTTGAAYEAARASAFIAWKLICQHENLSVTRDEDSAIPRFTDTRWQGWLSNLSPSEFRSRYERMLPESLWGSEVLARIGEHADPFTSIRPEAEYPVRAAARYAVEENLRVRTVLALLAEAESEGTLRLIGELLCQSHVAYDDCGLNSPECDELVARAREAGLAGAKMTGGGAGGVVAILGRATPEDRRAIERIACEYASSRNASPHIFEGSSCGVDAFGTKTMRLPLLEVR